MTEINGLTKPTLDQLHARLLGGDDAAAEEICYLMHSMLTVHVRRRLQTTDPHEICTAVSDALLTYLRNPVQFNPCRGALDSWLMTVALNRARDIRRRARRQGREVTSGIDLSQLISAELVASARESQPADRVLALARDVRERAFLQCRLAGSPMAVQAAALGVAESPPAEQRRVVYRAIERIVKRARRLRGN